MGMRTWLVTRSCSACSGGRPVGSVPKSSASPSRYCTSWKYFSVWVVKANTRASGSDAKQASMSGWMIRLAKSW